ncbi:LPS assembly lipoprotein LptE [Zavarzinella formosa]|uniref:LPS assembly lipoprotein LptE n=1 Tax=Zavarzinella formosa TaxID=360055 RepID=UPI0002E19F18|nr:LPS assembly lipoprotein LptE [Zavarzinella formosa]
MARTQPHSIQPSRRQALLGLFGLGSVLSFGCTTSGKNFCFLGYSTEPNYDPDIRSVYVPIFKIGRGIFETTPYRDMEFTLTRQVVDTIESTTPFKVISEPDRADTELQGTIVSMRKNVLNRTPFNEVRELELIIGVEIVWHDLRPGKEGKILTNPQRKKSAVDVGDLPFDTLNPPAPEGPQKPQPVLISDKGRVIPELGETNASGLDMVLKRLAVKIVSAMERPW